MLAPVPVFLIATCAGKSACGLWAVKYVGRAARAGREDCAARVLLCSVQTRNQPVSRAGETVAVEVLRR